MAAMSGASDHVESVLEALISFLRKYLVTSARVLLFPWSAAKHLDHDGRDPRMVSGLTFLGVAAVLYSSMAEIPADRDTPNAKWSWVDSAHDVLDSARDLAGGNAFEIHLASALPALAVALIASHLLAESWVWWVRKYAMRRRILAVFRYAFGAVFLGISVLSVGVLLGLKAGMSRTLLSGSTAIPGLYVMILAPFLLIVCSLWRDADGSLRGQARALVMGIVGTIALGLLLNLYDTARAHVAGLVNGLPPRPISLAAMPAVNVDGSTSRIVAMVVSHDPKAELPLITRRVFGRSAASSEPGDGSLEFDEKKMVQGHVTRWCAGDAPVMALKQGEPCWLEVEFHSDGGVPPLAGEPSWTLLWLEGLGGHFLTDGWKQRPFSVRGP